jgi:hypothetical protein
MVSKGTRNAAEVARLFCVLVRAQFRKGASLGWRAASTEKYPNGLTNQVWLVLAEADGDEPPWNALSSCHWLAP